MRLHFKKDAQKLRSVKTVNSDCACYCCVKTVLQISF